MLPPNPADNGSYTQLIRIRAEPSGQFSAEVVGLPELRATAATRPEALENVSAQLRDWLASGDLFALPLAATNPLQKWFGHFNPNDPIEQEFQAELSRLRREDVERTVQEGEAACSDSSSIPTT